MRRAFLVAGIVLAAIGSFVAWANHKTLRAIETPTLRIPMIINRGAQIRREFSVPLEGGYHVRLQLGMATDPRPPDRKSPLVTWHVMRDDREITTLPQTDSWVGIKYSGQHGEIQTSEAFLGYFSAPKGPGYRFEATVEDPKDSAGVSAELIVIPIRMDTWKFRNYFRIGIVLVVLGLLLTLMTSPWRAAPRFASPVPVRSTAADLWPSERAMRVTIRMVGVSFLVAALIVAFLATIGENMGIRPLQTAKQWQLIRRTTPAVAFFIIGIGLMQIRRWSRIPAACAALVVLFLLAAIPLVFLFGPVLPEIFLVYGFALLFLPILIPVIIVWGLAVLFVVFSKRGRAVFGSA